jgi:hypothetical protein
VLGEIAVIVMGFGVTVNPLNAVDVPTGVVTVTVLGPSAAWGSIVTVRGRLVAVPPLPIVAATPEPLNFTPDAPSRSVPVIVAPRVVPWAPVFGEIAVIDGKEATVKPLNAGEVPTGVVTVTVCSPSEAPGATDTITGKDIAVPPVPIVAETPVPLKVTALAPFRSLPMIVAFRETPGVATFGTTATIVGTAAGPH